MHPRIDRPPKHEDPGGHEERTGDSRWQAEFRLARPLDSRLRFEPAHEAASDAVPHGVSAYTNQQTGSYPHERQADLPQVELVDGPEDKGEGTKEEVKDSEENG